MDNSKTVNVGMIGYGFMGKTHSIGYRDVPVIAGRDVPRPRLLKIQGRNAEKLEEARENYGWQETVTDWRDIVSDPAIDLVDNAGPNSLHVEPTIAAVKAGKHVYCEKPLGRDAAESFRTWEAAELAGVRHMCAFNYRFFPALQLARTLIQSGELGEIYHYRSQFLVSASLGDTTVKTWREDAASAGSGALGDLGSHHIDLSRFLLGADPVRASGHLGIVQPKTASGETVETDQRFAALLDYDNGTLGVLEASRVAGGHLVTSRIEVDGSKGSLQFSMQRLNELRVAGRDLAFRAIQVLRDGDPYQAKWFPGGHPLGWVDTFSHEALHILGAIGGLHEVAPIGATFADGYRCAEIVDAIAHSSVERKSVDIAYRAVTRTGAPV